jgi:hypothetical protein
MTAGVVVTYQLRPEAMDEHVRLIEAVFEELRSERRTDVGYDVLRLADGVTFVHVATHDTADGSSPLPQLDAFQAFSADLGSRVATPPAPSAADVIGSHHVR